ncbi:Inositol-tetrakisphosphate 1-kinase 6 [Zea mays]|uniref:Inositol-tetrakisphosphate 1-kinase 6 n=1 Tax=Zea mays TaxID=4577 RepID=A0A3L6EFZ0_MAIZE|nr:Inositol-tetrakisphosphate 1-kinase 6 [Zea mays]
MATGRPVRLVLDASLLLDPSSTREATVVALRPGVEELLRYSNLTVAICYAEGMPTNEYLLPLAILTHHGPWGVYLIMPSSKNGIMLTKMNEKSVISNGKAWSNVSILCPDIIKCMITHVKFIMKYGTIEF